MFNVKISTELKKKSYYWYVNRNLKDLHKHGVINLSEYSSPITEKYVELLFINEVPVFIDVRDDFTLSPVYKNFSKNSVIFKANFSTELWDNPPDDFPYRIQEWGNSIRHQIFPFIYGRSFGIKFHGKPKEIFTSYCEKKQYDLVSYTGAGLNTQQTLSRLNIYDWLQNILKDKCKLIFFDRKHFKTPEEIENYQKRIQKYDCHTNLGLAEYYKFANSAKFLLNLPGIAMSQPFRCVDAVLSRTCIITTKLWQDIWKDFPCVELPICGFLGTGDFDAAAKILNNLDQIDITKMMVKASIWYNKYLTSQGMWHNQFLKGLNDD